MRNPFEPATLEEKSVSETSTLRKPSSSRKTFTTDLDSLLEEALQETFTEQMQASESDDPKAKAFHQQHRKPFSGLDLLIRRTVEAGEMEVQQQESGTRRLTVTFDKKKLEKLKTSARMEKSYLKDILGDIVAEYIRKYETKQEGQLG